MAASKSSSRPSSPLLPAFGIRDLNEPPFSLGVVQISAGQYDSTIRSQPDATLSYVDLDDGEVITVGTSFELGQRLDEPVSHAVYSSRSAVPAWPAFTNAREESQNKMHIFDIRRTSGSLAVWRDHEAYSSKSLRSSSASSVSSASKLSALDVPASSDLDSTSTLDTWTSRSDQNHNSSCDGPVVMNVKPIESKASTEAPNLVADGERPRLDKTLDDVVTGLQAHLGPLADFLESTALGLRKVAEKTREADTTPVENMLKGFKKILLEVGELGVQFMATLDQELEKSKETKSPEVVSEPEKQPLVFSHYKPLIPRDSVQKKVDFNNVTSIIPPPVSQTTENVATECPSRCTFTWPDGCARSLSRPFSASQAPVIDIGMSAPSTSVKPSLMTTFAPAPLQPGRSSIIDSQPSDSDVLIRYPPLPSLRKAASVSELKHKAQGSTTQDFGLNASSALSRYPSIGQFEHQARLKSNHGTDNKSPSKTFSIFKPPTPPLGTTHVDFFGHLSAHRYQKPTVEDVPDETIPRASWPKDKDRASKSPSEFSLEFERAGVDVLPPRDELVSTLERESRAKRNALNQSMQNCSGLDPPTGMLPSAMPIRGDLGARISSPVSETYTRPPVFPKRAQTVSGTNPAARLNGPFDPLAQVPVVQSRTPCVLPDLSSLTKSRPAGALPPLPPPGLPRRWQTVHHTEPYKPRESAPYQYSRPSLWQNYMQNNNSAATLPASRPWSFYPEPARPPQSRPSAPSVPEPSSIRPVKSTAGLRPDTAIHLPDMTSKSGRLTQYPLSIPPSQTAKPNNSERSPVNPAPAPFSSKTTSFPMRSWPNFSESAVPAIDRLHSTLAPHHLPVTPRGRNGSFPPPPVASKAVDECVRQLKLMGFGQDPNEMARLNVYAGAAAGDLEAAIEMIEEDREAAKELEISSQVSQLGSVGDVEKDFPSADNPWEDWD
jgi:hypothetical protein